MSAPPEALVAELRAAAAAAERSAGRPPLGVRAIEHAPGRRAYLVAFEGPAFLCLDSVLAPERDPRRIREAAAAGLLWEQIEAMVDAEALRELAAAVGRLLALGDDPPGITASLEVVAERAIALAAWREPPERALASLPELDVGSGLQARLAGAYERFVHLSEPLVEAQDGLPSELVDALAAIERAAARAGAGERLSERIVAAMPGCHEGAGEIMAALLGPRAAPGG